MQLPSLLICLAALTPLQDEGTHASRIDRRANLFTRSSQDAVALACDGQGSVLVWQSRRQQEGTYGVYARRFDGAGNPLTGEVQVNQIERSHQMQPAVDLAADGSAWFVWRSFAADGDQGAIAARRFSPELERATAEVLVNVRTEGHQSDPQVVALADGGAFIAWLSPDEEGRVGVFGRRLDATGAPAGDVKRLDGGSGHQHRTPCLRTGGDESLWISYARSGEDGFPQGVFVRGLDANGDALTQEERLDADAGIEAVVASNSRGQGVAAWLAPHGDTYVLRVRGLRFESDGFQLSEPRTLDTPGDGHTSGLDVTIDGEDRALLSWSHFGDGERQQAGLFARRVDLNGQSQGDVFRVTAAETGDQKLAAATGTRRSWLAGERMVFAWSGDADQGDKSGAHLTLIAPEERTHEREDPERIAEAALLEEDEREESGASPHDLPIFDPRDVERRSDDPTVYGSAGLDFLGFSNTGWTPPDPEMAVGPDHIVAMVNGGIAFFLKDGTLQFQQDINGGGGFWGSVGASNFVFDPEVVWDPFEERFVAFASDFNNGFVLAVSDDADPNGSWNKWRIDTGPLFGSSFVDSGNLAVDENFISLTGDIFNPDRLVMMFIDKASALAGGALNFTTSIINDRQSMGTCTNYDAGAQPQYLAWANESASANNIRIYAVTNRATSPSTQFAAVPVPNYGFPADPPQAGSSVRPELFEARFWSAMVRDGQLWATHHQGSPRATVRWYQIDLAGWPTSGNTPSLVQSGDIDLGNGVWTFFGSIWADAAGNMALTFARSSSNEFISMQMAYRQAGDPLGTLRSPILIQDSTSPSGDRWGDYSATNSDPANPGTFWGHHEYRESSWRTRIARIDLCPPGNSFCSTSPNSVGSGALMSNGGSTSLAANDLVLEAGPAPAGQTGIFYYGPSSLQLAFGEGFRCVGGQSVRLTPQTIGAGNTASRPIDYGNLPPNGTILSGATWYFQFWYRDPAGGGSNFNLSDGLQLTFCD